MSSTPSPWCTSTSTYATRWPWSFSHLHAIAGSSYVQKPDARSQAIERGSALHVFSPSGGLHHAHRDRASGFCTYDDPAIACKWLKDQGHRVGYGDVDVRHGDGVEDIFYADPDVLTIILYETGRYP